MWSTKFTQTHWHPPSLVREGEKGDGRTTFLRVSDLMHACVSYARQLHRLFLSARWEERREERQAKTIHRADPSILQRDRRWAEEVRHKNVLKGKEAFRVRRGWKGPLAAPTGVLTHQTVSQTALQRLWQRTFLAILDQWDKKKCQGI